MTTETLEAVIVAKRLDQETIFRDFPKILNSNDYVKLADSKTKDDTIGVLEEDSEISDGVDEKLFDIHADDFSDFYLE